MKTIIAPSILSANFLNLKEDINKIDNSKAEWIHFDVMDGHFVPNISFGPTILEVFKNNSNRFLDVHLMVNNPKFFIDLFIDAKADLIVFHYEATKDIEETKQLIQYIQEKGLKAGVSIKPKTNVEDIMPILDIVDLVLIMSVEPGFGGQSFMLNSLDKVKYLKEYQAKNKAKYLIQIDGGINEETAQQAANAGAQVLVAGSYLFKKEDFAAAVETLIYDVK
ncbi:ribulose-phosphate 3-epimerase [Mycoplasma sp. P36-A1]|uniref:ribulose-phosphate 3-epimerase n=1 Tax=Mycoplasma sp. P36-A1 TaxID=3252900 RepID=UPI003C2EA297